MDVNLDGTEGCREQMRTPRRTPMREKLKQRTRDVRETTHDRKDSLLTRVDEAFYARVVSGVSKLDQGAHLVTMDHRGRRAGRDPGRVGLLPHDADEGAVVRVDELEDLAQRGGGYGDAHLRQRALRELGGEELLEVRRGDGEQHAQRGDARAVRAYQRDVCVVLGARGGERAEYPFRDDGRVRLRDAGRARTPQRRAWEQGGWGVWRRDRRGGTRDWVVM